MFEYNKDKLGTILCVDLFFDENRTEKVEFSFANGKKHREEITKQCMRFMKGISDYTIINDEIRNDTLASIAELRKVFNESK